MNTFKHISIKKALIVIVAAVLLVLVYSHYFPRSFPSDESAIGIMNKRFSEVNASRVLDTLQLDDRHMFVPYVSSEDKYGLSYWVWNNFKWKVLLIRSTGEPELWKINEKDPSTHYMVWNINPKDQLSRIDFYLMRNRGYSISQGQKSNIYTPGIQKHSSVSLEGKSYGALQPPAEWEKILQDDLHLMNNKQSYSIFDSLQTNSSMRIGFITYNQQGESSFPTQSVNGGSFSGGNVPTRFINFINDNELERLQ